MKALVLIFVCFPVFSIGQTCTETVSTMAKKLAEAQNDTVRVDLLNYIANCSLQYGKINESFQNCQRAISLAQRIKYSKGIGDSRNLLGLFYNAIGKYPDALNSFFGSLEIREVLKDSSGIGACYCNIGISYKNLGNYPLALQSYLKAIEYLEKGDNLEFLANTFGNIGSIYDDQEEYDKALRYYFQGLKILQKTSDIRGIGAFYCNIGILYEEKNKFQEALSYFLKAKETLQKIGEKEFLSNTLGSLGSLYREMQNYESALKYYVQDLTIKEDINDTNGISICLSNIAGIYNSMHLYGKAKQYALPSLKFAIKVNSLENIKQANLILSNTYFGLNDYKSSLEKYKIYSKLKDSLYSRENTRKLVRSQMTFDFSRKQLADSLKAAEVQRIIGFKLEKQRTYSILGAVTAVVSIISIFFIAKERKKSEGLVLNILPKQIASQLKKYGKTDAQLFENVTVLFSDFVGFTKVSEKLTPQNLIKELDVCFKRFDEITSKYRIEKIKTIGDAYLAVCGLPDADNNHAHKIVLAALEFRDYMIARRTELGDNTFEVRIGVHTGSVIAGIVGVKKYAYDIWGDTVNTAARMEQNSEPGHVNISHATFEIVKQKFHCQYRGEITAKNKGPLKMYFVTQKFDPIPSDSVNF